MEIEVLESHGGMEITRRVAIKLLGGAGLTSAAQAAEAAVAVLVRSAEVEPPEPLRPGWSAFCLRPAPEGKATLTWKTGVPGPARLRLTVAFDARENIRLRATAARTGQLLGFFDIRFAYPFQPFDLPLTARQAEQAAAQGVGLEMEQGAGPLWLFREAPPEFGVSLAPHLRRAARVGAERFAEALASPAMAQPFGWMEGCVLDGLEQRVKHLRAKRDEEALAWHIQAFFDHRRMPRYVPHADSPVSHGTEGLLPFAALARHDAAHPAFEGMLEFCDRAAEATGGIIRDGRTTTAEGCYTLAYPLAVLGVVRDDRRLRDLAVKQLVHRIERLAAGDVLYLRAADGGTRTFPNWARGVAWFALGLVRTAGVLPAREVPAEVREAFAWCAELALKWQDRRGLWSCFIDQPETGPETSGSAGIATALAAGARLLPDPARAIRAARAAHRELMKKYLEPGGFLGTVSQANRDGERLQRGGYRVIAHYGAGLLAQLDAAIATLA